MREALSQQGISEDRDSTSNHSSEESELMTSPTVEGDDVTRSPEDLILGSKQHRKERPHQLSLADANCQTFTSTAMSGTGALRRSNSTPGIECKRPSLTVSVGSEDVHSRPVTSVRSPPSLRPTSSIPAVQPDPRAPASRVSWDEGSVGTAGTSEVPVFSGIPESDDDDEDEDGDGDDDLFEAANDTDLDAVDLCVSCMGRAVMSPVMLAHLFVSKISFARCTCRDALPLAQEALSEHAHVYSDVSSAFHVLLIRASSPLPSNLRGVCML